MGFQSKVIENKRSLGQNFFINRNLAKQISELVLDEKPDLIVEIGPGTGAFSQYLVNTNSDLIMVEKDNLLANELQKRFPKSEIVNADFLNWDMQELEKYKQDNILFFGSLPYNVSKKIIRKILESEYFNTNSYFIIQKEVAQKYTSTVPENNFLSVSTSLYAKVERLFDISSESFRPKPNVESSFVKFIPSKLDKNIPFEIFIKFLKTCFRQPRKTLRNNLKGAYEIEIQDTATEELLSKRAQHLSLNDFLSLFCNIK